jgi:hypothetical protein
MSNSNFPKKVRIAIFAMTAATMVMTLVAASLMTAAMPAYAAKGGVKTNENGAVVEKDFLCGVPTEDGGFALTTDSHAVVTPSGNSNLQCHLHPK